MSPQSSYPFQPPPKKGLSQGAKLVIGGCLALLVIVIIIGALGFWVARKTTQGVARLKADYDRQMGIDPTLADIRSVLAIVLIREFEADEAAADRYSHGKKMEVQGLVEAIQKSGQAYVILKSSSKGNFGVQCFFAAERRDELASLKEGQFAAIRGVCDGKKQNIEFIQCELKAHHDP